MLSIFCVFEGGNESHFADVDNINKLSKLPYQFEAREL
jgi:hypothetical protein